MRHIFTGPSTALGDDSRATRSCNASLHDMTTVEAEHIAYACVQASFISIDILNVSDGLISHRHASQSATRTNGPKPMVNSTTEPSTTTSSTSFVSARIETGQRDFSNGGTSMFSLLH
jgi:hypothetical protein